MLRKLGLTYPQYIVMLILWEKDHLSVSEIGALAQLNSNTLTPLLKRLETQGLIQRITSKQDERQKTIVLTTGGLKLKQHCAAIPATLREQRGVTVEKAKQLKTLLDELLADFDA
ncbi:Organic hydroperoxide resistance transcriptional regulator [Pseudoalteromonas luteoviolacea B = ATCC 29581]|nr:Organic hydroperoxide resistance transcriptional regulator [Pseudoalteromonas luteoviolacea B = ATCC 29581]